MADQAGSAVVCMGGLIVSVIVLIIGALFWLSKGNRNGGLSSADHGRLNSWNWQQNATSGDYRNVRRQYRGNHRAQRQIDIYGGSQEYRVKMASYRSALKSGNEQRAAKLERWFDRHGYSDV